MSINDQHISRSDGPLIKFFHSFSLNFKAAVTAAIASDSMSTANPSLSVNQGGMGPRWTSTALGSNGPSQSDQTQSHHHVPVLASSMITNALSAISSFIFDVVNPLFTRSVDSASQPHDHTSQPTHDASLKEFVVRAGGGFGLNSLDHTGFTHTASLSPAASPLNMFGDFDADGNSGTADCFSVY